jgi:hypothetical protein
MPVTAQDQSLTLRQFKRMCLFEEHAKLREISADWLNTSCNPDNGVTPFMLSVLSSNESVINTLIGIEGVNIAVCDLKGRNAFMHAVSVNNQAAMRALLACPELDLDVVDKGGWTAHDYARYTHCPSTVEMIEAEQERRELLSLTKRPKLSRPEPRHQPSRIA